jgi:hypothetical protein
LRRPFQSSTLKPADGHPLVTCRQRLRAAAARSQAQRGKTRSGQTTQDGRGCHCRDGRGRWPRNGRFRHAGRGLLWGVHLSFSLDIGATGSHVPHTSLNQGHAACMPDAIWAVNRSLPASSRVNDSPPVLTSSLRFRHLLGGSLALVSLAHT